MRRLTPAGAGGVCVLSVSGSDAFERLRRLGVDLGREEALARGPVPRLVRLCLGGEELDEALLCVRGPEELELHLHASPPLVREVESALLRTDSKPATRGLSLEDRAWRALASAPSEEGARLLLDQAEGALRAELEALAGLDAGRFAERVDALLEQARVARWLLDPARVVLAGPVNAGKSTLFNVLLGHERALVADEPGTTRDAIRERALLGPWPVELVDTAGERGDGDELERAGQALARGLARSADLVLRLSRLGAEMPSMDGPALATCADRVASGPPWPADAISAKLDPEGARRAVRAVFERGLRLPREPWCSGRGVPFERAEVELLAALRDAPADERRRGLASVLDAGTI